MIYGTITAWSSRNLHLQGVRYMKYYKFIFVFALTFILLTMNACGAGDPVGGSTSDQIINNAGLNSGNIGLDGVMIDSGEDYVRVLPGSAHLLTVVDGDNPECTGYIVSCTAGTWWIDGEMAGNEAFSESEAFEWVAPLTVGEVQLLFSPMDGGDDSLYGIVVYVSVNPEEIPLEPEEPVHEIMFTDMLTGITAAAVEGELLVKLAPYVSITEILDLQTAQNYRILDRISRDEPIFRMKLDPGADLADVMLELSQDPRVEVVEPNYLAYTAVIPTDPFYSEKFEFPKIDAEPAWDIETGSSDVWVAVVDTGVDRDHPDLEGNVVPGADFISGGDGYGGETPGDGIDNNEDGIIDQNVGHGTHVAGIIAAEANNGTGACGIAWNATILPLRIFPANGDTGASFSAIIDAVNYAANVGNVKVISMSIGTTYESSLLQSTINGAWARGKVLVAAAANANTNEPYYPAAHNNVISVAALNKNGQKASFSNYGSWIDISAYGTGIYSTYFNDSSAYLSGTSMACPLVSGVVALLFSYDGGMSNQQCVQTLLIYTDDVDGLNPAYSGQLGSGIVNPYLALDSMFVEDPVDIDDADSDGHPTDFGLEF